MLINLHTVIILPLSFATCKNQGGPLPMPLMVIGTIYNTHVYSIYFFTELC